MAEFKQDDILLFLAAGASADAGIPVSAAMIRDIENRVNDATNNQWNRFRDLYYYFKGALLYSATIKGRTEYSPNIEDLMNAIRELEKKEEHTIYPFIGAWNIKLMELSGDNFSNLREFDQAIMGVLKEWICLGDFDNNAGYYRGIVELSKEIGTSLRIFTLNYDRCLEELCAKNGATCERGFDSEKMWSSERFDNENLDDPNIYLYKLHGSIDWYRDPNDMLKCHDSPGTRVPDLIFGTNYKLQYNDPYLFLMHELRRWLLNTKLLVIIGYGFQDEHINKIISNAFGSNRNLKLYVIGLYSGDDYEDYVKRLLGIDDGSRLKVENRTAKDFMDNLNVDLIKDQFFTGDDETPF